jgi:hypothetical protein
MDRVEISTEIDWLNCTDPFEMQTFVRESIGDRKIRLFTVGCCRRIWHLLSADSRHAVEVSEECADQMMAYNDIRAKRLLLENTYTPDLQRNPILPNDAAYMAAWWMLGDTLEYPTTFLAKVAVSWASTAIAVSSNRNGEDTHDAYEDKCQCELLRDIVGNPFRAVAFDPIWRTDTTVSLARSMYDSRHFDALPILGDALEEAGCDNAAMIDHCRGPGPHVRGCWVVDLLLGKQ